MLSSIANATKSTQIYPKLPKTTQIQLVSETLKYHQKLEFWYFSIKETLVCRGGTKTYAYHLDFQYKNFPYVFFIVKKRPLYVNFSITPLCKKTFFSRFHTSRGYEILVTCTKLT
jgi:hypothetical protein